MLRFEGHRHFSQPVGPLWEKLSDPRFLVQCIPDVESVLGADAETAQFKLRPGFSFVRGTLEVSLRAADVGPEKSIRFLVHSKGIGSTSDVQAALAFEPMADGTQVRWQAEIKEVGGLLKAVPQGLIKAATQKVIGDVWAAIEAKLAGETDL